MMGANAAALNIALLMGLAILSPGLVRGQSTAQNHAARTLFLEGRDFLDAGKLAEAERKFHEALTKYPKADQSDGTAFYRISTLIKLGRPGEALAEIEQFNRNYPQSPWKTDVEEERISVAGSFIFSTNRVVSPNRAQITTPVKPFSGNKVIRKRNGGIVTMPAFTAVRPIPFTTVAGTPSFESEVLRVILEKDADRGIELAKERLKNDPADPAVISNLSTIAGSTSAHAVPFLVTLAGSSDNPNARSLAIFWMSRHNGDKNALAKAFVDMVANSRDQQTDAAVAAALARLNSMERRQAIQKFIEVKSPLRLSMFQKIYRNSPNAQVRTQLIEAAAQLPDARSVSFLSDVARRDADSDVRRSATRALAGRKDGTAKLSP
jgi:tetratricopeptide (TPR) repeat protein